MKRYTTVHHCTPLYTTVHHTHHLVSAAAAATCERIHFCTPHCTPHHTPMYTTVHHSTPLYTSQSLYTTVHHTVRHIHHYLLGALDQRQFLQLQQLRVKGRNRVSTTIHHHTPPPAWGPRSYTTILNKINHHLPAFELHCLIASLVNVVTYQPDLPTWFELAPHLASH